MSDALENVLVEQADLSPDQARGVLGVLLRKLRERLPPADYQRVAELVSSPETCLRQAPKTGGGLLGGLASLGGEKARLLMEMNQALSALGIPASRARRIGETLRSHVESRHPDLLPIFQGLL